MPLQENIILSDSFFLVGLEVVDFPPIPSVYTPELTSADELTPDMDSAGEET